MKENTKKKEKREYSLKKKVLVILMGSTVPIVLFLIFFNWFVLLEMNNRIAEASRNALFIQCQNMERNMAGIEMALLRITAEEAAFQKLAYSPSNEYDNYVNEYDTSLNLKKAMYPYDDWWASMVISVPKDVYRILYNTGSNSNIESPKIFYEIKDMAIKGNLKKVSKWYPIKVGKDSYLIRVLGYKDTYVVSIIDLKNVLLMQDNEEDNRTITMFYDEEKIYANVDFVALDNLQKKKNYSFVRIDGENYMLISSKLENSNLEVAYITPKVTIWKVLSKGHIILLVLSICMIAVIPISYERMKHILFSPLDKLVKKMDWIREGNSTDEIETDVKEKEFRKVYEAMHDMLSEIKLLKIDAYEKEIMIQKTTLEYYQIQIRPHFYLNCLKHIYSMVEVGKYRDVQKSIILLSKHLRYMLGEIRGMVKVQEELQYICNYMELQQIGIEYPLTCDIRCSQDLETFLIPAFSLLTFVENSVKHGLKINEPLCVQVVVETLKTEQEKLLHIRVSDNGQGYDEEVLRQLNFKSNIFEQKRSLGIHNVLQRFKLQYGENVFFSFSNLEGAETEIFIRLLEA